MLTGLTIQSRDASYVLNFFFLRSLPVSYSLRNRCDIAVLLLLICKYPHSVVKSWPALLLSQCYCGTSRHNGIVLCECAYVFADTIGPQNCMRQLIWTEFHFKAFLESWKFEAQSGRDPYLGLFRYKSSGNFCLFISPKLFKLLITTKVYGDNFLSVGTIRFCYNELPGEF